MLHPTDYPVHRHQSHPGNVFKICKTYSLVPGGCQGIAWVSKVFPALGERLVPCSQEEGQGAVRRPLLSQPRTRQPRSTSRCGQVRQGLFCSLPHPPTSPRPPAPTPTPGTGASLCFSLQPFHFLVQSLSQMRLSSYFKLRLTRCLLLCSQTWSGPRLPRVTHPDSDKVPQKPSGPCGKKCSFSMHCFYLGDMHRHFFCS